MRQDEIKIGMLATVSNHKEATIFRIAEVDDPEDILGCRLHYPLLDGSYASAGWQDYAVLEYPKRSQVLSSIDELDKWFDERPEYDGKECNAPIWKEYQELTSYLRWLDEGRVNPKLLPGWGN